VFRRYEPQGYDKQGREIIDLVPLNPNYPTLRIDSDNSSYIRASSFSGDVSV
jgi:hypothetical protein